MLDKKELAILKKLNTPRKIQDYLNKLKINFEEKEPHLLDLNINLRDPQEVIKYLAVYKQARENYGLTRYEETGMIALERISKFQKVLRAMKTRREQPSRRSSKNFPI